MKKKITKGILISTGIVLASTGIILGVGSIEKTTDVTPPYGSLVIKDSTKKGAKSYVNSSSIEVEIHAQDDTCEPNEIEYYVSTTPIDQTKPMKESLWKPYSEGIVETLELMSADGNNTIYAMFRDKYGNTSGIFTGNNAKYQIKYDANGGVNPPPTQNAYYGTAVNLTAIRPTYDGKYFVGWSTTKGSSMADYEGQTIYKQGEKIAANAFTGDEKTITLYAVWTDNIDELPTLAESVKIGDYVNYPVEYENVFTGSNGQYKATLTGWRVIGINEDGTVNLVSAGVPLTYYQANSTATSIKKLAINFLDIPFSISENYAFRNSGFNPYISLEETFDNKYTASYEADETVSYTSTYGNGTVKTYTGEKQAGDLKVRAMTKEDLDKIYDSTGATVTAVGTSVTDAKYEKLLAIPVSDVSDRYAMYYLASAGAYSNLWRVYSDGNIDYIGYNIEYGIRPVVTLKPNVRTTGVDSTGAWDIEIFEE